MRRIARLVARAACPLALFAFGLAPARGDLIASVSAVVTLEAGGSYLYAYTVSVDPTSTVGAAEFDMSVDVFANIDPATIQEPTGFLALYTPGDSYVQFLSTDPSTDIAPGGLGMFSFTSPEHAALQSDLVRGFDVTGAPFEVGGSALAPVPEPSSVALLGLGAVAVTALGLRPRRPAASARVLRRLALAVAASLSLMALAPAPSRASDHADTAENFNRIGVDLTDLYIFPNPSDASRVVLVMDSHGLIPAGQGGNIAFDPQVLYQFKIDTTGDHVEDLVMQFRFVGTGPNQQVLVSGPAKPAVVGTTSIFGRPYAKVGKINQLDYSPTPGVNVFAGVRSEPFFLDLNRFYQILPDRATPLSGMQVNLPMPNTPQVNGFRGFPAGSGYDSSPAMDYLINLNVMSIVVEMPKSMLGGGVIGVWMTSSLANGAPGYAYSQQDRLARPVVNEALATVSNLRHEVNNKDRPVDDKNQLATDIFGFMKYPAGRSDAIANTLVAVLVPDVMLADLSQNTTAAAYLGVETGGASGSKFGGRALTDDVVDTALMAVFGNLIPALGLAHDDGKELPQFATDNVGPHGDYLGAFPYLGNPH